MREIKKIFDPDGIMNPDKIFNAEKLIHNNSTSSPQFLLSGFGWHLTCFTPAKAGKTLYPIWKRRIFMDVLTGKQRSYCMSQIKGKNTIPELTLRKSLWKKGWRYRVNSKLPGKPDLVFRKLRVAVFIDGCFWHKCPRHFQYPKTNRVFWRKKISGNVTRDRTNNRKLASEKWKVMRFWEHDIKERLNAVEKKIERTLKSRTCINQ